MEQNSLTYAVIGHAQKVHSIIGPGIDEIFYHRLLGERLAMDGIEHSFKPRGVLYHRGSIADLFEPDLVLPGRLVPELKVLSGKFEPGNFLQLQAYLKFWKIRQGLLMDYGKESLVLRSYLYDEPPPVGFGLQDIIAEAPMNADAALVRALGECFARVGSNYGFGFRDTTYRGLLMADLNAEEIVCAHSPTATVSVDGHTLGHATLTRFIVAGGEVGILVLSQRQGIRAADRAVVQTALRLLELSWGVIAHFGKREFQVQWVSPVTRGIHMDSGRRMKGSGSGSDDS